MTHPARTLLQARGNGIWDVPRQGHRLTGNSGRSREQQSSGGLLGDCDHEPYRGAGDIIRHDLNSHAKVLAVAGAGKTTTMVERIDYLIRQCKTLPQAIRVVMFNGRIQEEFEAKVKAKGLDGVKVQTFHGLGNAICSWAVKQQAPARLHYDGGRRGDRRPDPACRPGGAGERATDRGRGSRDLEESPASHVENLRTSISIWKGMMTPARRPEHLSLLRLCPGLRCLRGHPPARASDGLRRHDLRGRRAS